MTLAVIHVLTCDSPRSRVDGERDAAHVDPRLGHAAHRAAQHQLREFFDRCHHTLWDTTDVYFIQQKCRCRACTRSSMRSSSTPRTTSSGTPPWTPSRSVDYCVVDDCGGGALMTADPSNNPCTHVRTKPTSYLHIHTYFNRWRWTRRTTRCRCGTTGAASPWLSTRSTRCTSRSSSSATSSPVRVARGSVRLKRHGMDAWNCLIHWRRAPPTRPTGSNFDDGMKKTTGGRNGCVLHVAH